MARRIAAEINGSHTDDRFRGDGYCTLETGENRAGFAFGEFFVEPSPQIQFKKVGKAWHWGKVMFEQWWLTPFGLRREMLRQTMNLGSRIARLPVSL